MGIAEDMGKGISSLLKELNKQKSAASSARTLAQNQEYEAAYQAVAAEQQNNYLLQTAAEKARNVYQNYLQNQGSQRAKLGASGLRSDSATVQYMLKNNRFQALLDEQNIQEQLQSSVAVNNFESAEKVRALRAAAAENRRAASGHFNLGTSLLRLWGGL